MEDLFGAPAPAAAAAPQPAAAAAADKDLFVTSGPAVNIDLGIARRPYSPRCH